MFLLVIASKGRKAGVTNEFARYMNGTVKLRRKRHILWCSAESRRRYLSNGIVDLNLVAQRSDIEPENRTSVMALGRLTHLLQVYICLDVLRTVAEIDLNSGGRG